MGIITTSAAVLHSSKSSEQIFSVYVSISSAKHTESDRGSGATDPERILSELITSHSSLEAHGKVWVANNKEE